MSSATSVNETLLAYIKSQVSAQQLIAAVAAEYYRETTNGKREALRPIIEVIERAHPGIVELKASAQRPGFDVTLAERPFPKRHETELRQAVESVLQALPVSRISFPESTPRKLGLLRRLVAAIRRVFSA